MRSLASIAALTILLSDTGTQWEKELRGETLSDDPVIDPEILRQGELGELDGRIRIIDSYEAIAKAAIVAGMHQARMMELALRSCAPEPCCDPGYYEYERPYHEPAQRRDSKPKNGPKQHIRATMRSVNRNR